MLRFRIHRFPVIAGALALALVSSLALAGPEQARQKTGSREKPRTPSREAPRPDAGDGIQVSVTPDRKFVRQGDTLRLVVSIDRGENVGHVPFHLNYDPAVLRFVSGEEGEFLGNDGHDTVFLASPASSGGAVVVGLSRLGRQVGVAGKGRLCTLEFTAVGPGDAKLNFARASVRDAENRALPAEFRAGTLVVR